MTNLTRYEQGFLNKCAEYGVPDQVAGAMLKQAALSQDEFKELRALKGLTTDNVEVNYSEYLKRRRLMKILMPLLLGAHGAVVGGAAGGGEGALAGAGLGAGAGLAAAGAGIGLANLVDRNHLNRNREGKPASWWAM